MAQFDVHRYGKQGGRARFLLDLQSDLLQGAQTRIVAPLYEKRSSDEPIRGINPELELNGKTYFVSMMELAAVHKRELGERVGSLVTRRDQIVAGLDLLFTGI